jgi:hypothetical protein
MDPTNAVIPGATVRLQTETGSDVQATVTDHGGRFHFSNVGTGRFLVEAAREGFKTTSVTFVSGQQKTLSITLPVGAPDQQVTVQEDSSQVNIESNGNRDAIDAGSNLLEQLPIFDQDYIATLSMFVDPGSAGTSGVALIVNGLEATRVGVSPSAIQQVKINDDPYAAEFFRPGRGRIEVITKAAAPEYHGTFNFITRNSSLNAANAFATTKPPEQRRIYEGFLTGPIAGSKKTFFQVSIDRQELNTQAIVFAQGISGAIRENVPAPIRNTEVSARITHVFSDLHTDTIDYSLEQNSDTDRGVGGVVLASAGTHSFSQEHQWGLTDTFTVSPRILNQFQIRFEKNRDSTNSSTPDGKIVVVDAFTSGGAQVDQWRTEKALHLNEIVTWSGKHQTIKAGMNVPNLSWRSFVDESNFAGTYYFSSLQAYAAGQPYSFTMQRGNGRVFYDQLEMGAFFQDEVRLRPNLAVTVGLRYDWQNALHDTNNFASRLSFAYSPTKSHNLVLRGGAGVFFDRTGPTPIADLARYDGNHLQSIVITNPLYPDPFTGGNPSDAPSNLVVLASSAHIPYTIQYSFSVERQLFKSATLAAAYRGAQGIDLFRSRDANAPLPPLYSARPDSGFGTIREIDSNASQVSNALEVSLKGRISKRVTGMAQYTLSKTYNNTSGITYFPANSIDPSGEWGRADFDQRHRLNLLETISAGRFVNLGVGLRIYSGKPYTITTGLDQNHDGLANERPAKIPRNSAHGPAYTDLDLRWFHDFKLMKSRKQDGPTITTAIDGFNILNRSNYPTFVGDLSSPFFGRPVSALDPRMLQFTARLKF